MDMLIGDPFSTRVWGLREVGIEGQRVREIEGPWRDATDGNMRYIDDEGREKVVG